MFHIHLTNALISLPEESRETLIILRSKDTIIDFNKTRLPRSMNDARWFYITNKTSIYENISSTNIHTHSNHAYVSIQSVVHHALALGIEIRLKKSSQYFLSTTNFDNSDILRTAKSEQISRDSLEHN